MATFEVILPSFSGIGGYIYSRLLPSSIQVINIRHIQAHIVVSLTG